MSKENVISLAKFIEEFGATNTVVLDVEENCSWTDYFVIASLASKAQLSGLMEKLSQYLESNSLESSNSIKRTEAQEWTVIDLSNIIIHLMSPKARGFYELEKLWYESKILFGEIQNNPA